MVSQSKLDELKRLFCKDAQLMQEAGLTYIHMPNLQMPKGVQPEAMEALLCLQARDGYTTRLFLASRVSGKGQNWTVHNIFSKGWHTCSWNNVPYIDRPAETLAQHLKALI